MLSAEQVASLRRQVAPLDLEAAGACGPAYLLPAEVRKFVLSAVFAEWDEADAASEDSATESMGPAERALKGLLAARGVEACAVRSWS